jgi:hypothetical protein
MIAAATIASTISAPPTSLTRAFRNSRGDRFCGVHTSLSERCGGVLTSWSSPDSGPSTGRGADDARSLAQIVAASVPP